MSLQRDNCPTVQAAATAKFARMVVSLVLADALALSGVSVALAADDSAAPEGVVVGSEQADDLTAEDDGGLTSEQAADTVDASLSEAAHDEELAQAVAKRLLDACDPAQDAAASAHQAFNGLCRELRALPQGDGYSTAGDDLRGLVGDATPASTSRAVWLVSRCLGLEAVEVVGADGARWNMVQLDGRWAHVDVLMAVDAQGDAEPLMSDAQLAELAPARAPWALADGQEAPVAEGLAEARAESAGESEEPSQGALSTVEPKKGGSQVGAASDVAAESEEEPVLAAQATSSASGAANPLRVVAKSLPTYKLYDLIKRALTVSAVSVSGSKGKLTYSNASYTAQARRFLVNSSTGKITIPKGTEAGTYSVRVKVHAAGGDGYKAADKYATVSVTVKDTRQKCKMKVYVTGSTSVDAKSLRPGSKGGSSAKDVLFKCLKVSMQGGRVTYERVSGAFPVNSRTGVITIPAGTKPRSKPYEIGVRITDAGSSTRQGGSVEKTVKITVKGPTKGKLAIAASAGLETTANYEEASSNVLFCGYADDWSVINKWVKHFDGYLYLPEGKTYSELSKVLAKRRSLVSLGEGDAGGTYVRGAGGTYTIQSGLGDLALDAAGTEEGAAVQLAAPTGAASQQWEIKRVESADGYATWSIKNVGTGLYLVGTGLGESNEGGADWDHWGQELKLSAYPTFDNQHNSQGEWRVLQVEDDSFELLNCFDGLCVDAGSDDAVAGSTVQGWGRYDGKEQRWILRSVEPRAVAAFSYEAARSLVLAEGVEVVRAEGSASTEGAYTLEDVAAFKQDGDSLTVTYVDGGTATYTYDEQDDAYVDATDPKNVIPGGNVFVGERGSSEMTLDAQTGSLTVRWWNSEERKVYEDQRGLAYSIEPNYATSIEVKPYEPVKLEGAKDYVLDEATGTLQLTEEGENRLHRYADVLTVHYEDEYGEYNENYARTATGTLDFASKSDSVRLKGKIACTCDFEASCAVYTYAGASCTVPFELVPGTNPLKVTATAQKVLAADVKSAAKSVAALKVTGNKGGALSYAKASGSAQLSVDKATGKVSVRKGTAPGTYKAQIKVTSAANTVYAACDKTVEVTVKVVGAQPMKVKAVAKTVKASAVKKAKKVVARPLSVKGAQGTLSYKKVSGSKYLSVNAKTGKVTIKKGTPKGTYKIKIKVTAAGTDIYQAGSKTVLTKVVVK